MNSEKTPPTPALSPSADVATPTEPLSAEALAELAVAALENMKGVDVRVLDVRGQCNFADFMVFSSGTSDRHLKSQANSVVEAAKAKGVRPMGVEGDQTANTEWVLVDLIDVLVHIMLPETRDHYQLEKLWAAHSAAQDKSEVSTSKGSSAYASALEKIRGGATPDSKSLETDWDADLVDDDSDQRVDTDKPFRL